MTLRAIAQLGEDAYVIVSNEAAAESLVPQNTPARILDTRDGELSPTMYFGSIIAHNPYLEPIEVSIEETQALLDEAEITDPSIGTPEASGT
jgi:hypothetical protein